jgi:Tannase and feruloyl esterase
MLTRVLHPGASGSRRLTRSDRTAAALAALSVCGVAALVGLSASAQASSRGHATSRAARAQLGCDTGALRAAVDLRNVTVTSAARNSSGSFTAPITPPLSDTGPGPWTGLPSYCSVSITQTDSAGNAMHDVLWLPDAWNGRFMGVGGGGYSCGIGFSELAAAIQAGYAAASTDCGVGANALDGSWALTSSNQLDTALITDFSSVGIHAMSVTAQTVTRDYYAHAATYSYFNGCSTGGREGLMEAQRYPADYDGIVSGAPAINWTKFIPAEIWPELVMKESNDFLPACKEQAFVDAVTAACGGTDGVIQDPDRCRWTPSELVGLQTPCGMITSTDASVVAKIWRGPTSTDGRRLWYGLEPGTSFSGLAGTTTDAIGATTGAPFPIAVDYLGKWLLQKPSWDWHTLSYAQFDQLSAQSVRQYADVIATDDPDLSQFKRRGGKVLIWHGLADSLIFPQGSVNYYQRVERTLGPHATRSFARLFLAPGAQHCGQGAGPAPSQFDTAPGSALTAVVEWVEHGKAPRSILATKVDPVTNVVTESRPLCPYPQRARYTGRGNPNQAASYSCRSRSRGPRATTSIHAGRRD